jgi:hypothetical protein
MTQRGDPRAYFNVVNHPAITVPGCEDPLAGAQEMRLSNGGNVCVRRASGGRWEFRYSGKGNTKGRSLLFYQFSSSKIGKRADRWKWVNYSDTWLYICTFGDGLNCWYYWQEGMVGILWVYV